MVDLGAIHGPRLHHPTTLAFMHTAVKMAYTMVKTFKISRSVESYFSSYVGCYARERLLVSGALRYGIISGTRAAPKFTHKQLLQSPPLKLVNHCDAYVGPLVRKPVTNLSAIPGRHLHRADGCISSVLCCGQAPPSVNQGRGDSGSATTVPAGPDANEWKFNTGDYMKVFGEQMTSWFLNSGPAGAGTFLDVGGTGNTKAGMKQTAFKFAQVIVRRDEPTNRCYYIINLLTPCFFS